MVLDQNVHEVGMSALRSVDRKVEELAKLAGPEAEYVPDDLTRNDEWIAGSFGIQRRDARFFRITLVRLFTSFNNTTLSEALNSLKGLSLAEKVKAMKQMAKAGPAQALKRGHLQPVLVQEASQYDRSACFKTIGHVALPMRTRDVDGQEVSEFGITAKRSVGAYGEVTFTGPRCSLSNPEKLTPEEAAAVLYHRLVRPDPNRMTGRVGIWVLRGNENQYKNCVWFTRDELKELAEHELMDDTPTMVLMNWVLGNIAQ